MSEAQQKATNVHWHEGAITREDRHALLGQKGCTVWLTGLSGSGKSTITVELEKVLVMNSRVCYRLDGDNIRMGLNKNLGFSADDRVENIRRIGEVAKLFGDLGVITTTAFISPYAADREICRKLHEDAKIPFFEVLVDCPLSVAESRDPKGLYKKARAGLIKNFTGIDDPYEAPAEPDVTVDTSKLSVEECVGEIISFLQSRDILPKDIDLKKKP
ncbi:Adenylyl-sulfate kinase [Porphyridium purpureum]|uniref:Adenylyl-sulfate kinase n=1 Tax=Porphyridium purpureum TaxID=35688 RepID=A0A5J4YMX6_PORPP|nr:Adenylyl-sulfate kinase [Porphyridium purpureum]|eukprot:POR5538..scf244_11